MDAHGGEKLGAESYILEPICDGQAARARLAQLEVAVRNPLGHTAAGMKPDEPSLHPAGDACGDRPIENSPGRMTAMHRIRFSEEDRWTPTEERPTRRKAP